MASLTISRKPQFKRRVLSYEDLMARACTGAIRDAAFGARNEGRADIASSGFSRRWVTGLRATLFPRRGFRINASARINHRFGFAGVFEHGATIRGKPLLWLPLSDTPTRASGRRQTPKQVARSEGLASVNRLGKRPLLVSKKTRKPVFVGIDAVTIRKRFSIGAITQKWASRLVDFYAQRMRRR